MTSSLLFGSCIGCGEPIFRHRINRRQITCEQLRSLDQAFKASGTNAEQSARPLYVLRGGRDLDGKSGVGA